MESISLQQKEIAKDLLEQIRGAIENLLEWNKEYSEADDFLNTFKTCSGLSNKILRINGSVDILRG